jgi:hypothetical protein
MRHQNYILKLVKKRRVDHTWMRNAFLTIHNNRHMAAKVHQYHPGEGQRIQALRAQLKAVDNSPCYKLVSLKHKIKLDYSPRCRKNILDTMHMKIRNLRASLKGDYHQDHLDAQGWDHQALTHHSFGDIFRKFCKIALGSKKTPTTSDRHIGVEIECFMPENVDFAAFLPFREWVDIGQDASIHAPDQMQGVEVRMLATEQNYAGRISAICEVLRKIGAEVNASCGLHVHLDMRNLDKTEIKKRFANLVSYQDWLFSLVPPSRRDNHYCRRTEHADPDHLVDRYQAINPCAIAEHQTIEVRLHSGTTNADKIIHWISLLLAITRAPAVKQVPQTVQALARRLDIDPQVRRYIESRRSLFQLNPNSELEALQCANS